MIQYHLSFQPGYPYLEVEVLFEQNTQDPQAIQFQLATWAPGSYKDRHFPGQVSNVHVYQDDTQDGQYGKEISVRKFNTDTWSVAPCQGKLKIRYQVYSQDRSVRSAYIGRDYAFFNGPAVFIKLIGRENESAQVTLKAPESDDTWQLVSLFESKTEQSIVFRTVEKYRDLIEYPIIWSKTKIETTFSLDNVPSVTLSLFGHERWLTDVDMAQLKKDVRKICEAHAQFLGPQPFGDSYQFLLFVTESDYGGLEHPTNSFNICSAKQLPKVDDLGRSHDYIDLLGLLAHELFHNPWVTKVKPRPFVEFDGGQIPLTTMLWLFEGATRYFELRLLLKVISEEDYLHHLSWLITDYLRWPGRHVECLADSATNAPTKFYQAGANIRNDSVSYYSQGGVFVLWLDKTIRELTSNRFGMDQVIQHVVEQYFNNGFVVEDSAAFQALAEKVCQLESGALSEVFDKGLYQTGDYPIESIAAYFGLDYQTRAAFDDKDRGGVMPEDKQVIQMDIGVRIQKNESGVKVIYVRPNSPAEDVGILPGDVITEIQADGHEPFTVLNPDNFQSVLDGLKDLAIIQLKVTGVDSEESLIDVKTQAPVEDRCQMAVDGSADNGKHENRQAWLTLA